VMPLARIDQEAIEKGAQQGLSQGQRRHPRPPILYPCLSRPGARRTAQVVCADHAGAAAGQAAAHSLAHPGRGGAADRSGKRSSPAAHDLPLFHRCQV
jgi:hypothetical protein